MSHVTLPADPGLSTEPRRPARRPALAIGVYAATVYLLMLASLGYAVGFFTGLAVPKGIDSGPHTALPAAVSTDVLLLVLFAVQHTVMARPWFKRRWTRLVPVAAERATFVLAATLLLALLFWRWRPIGATVWSVAGLGADLVWAAYAAGWALVIGSTFAISHADMFGLRQAWCRARGLAYTPVPFSQRGPYRFVRHPLMAGFVLVFWSAPVMTAGHLLFAAVATGYIAVGIAFEEHDLIHSLGDRYLRYRHQVPALIPGRPARPETENS